MKKSLKLTLSRETLARLTHASLRLPAAGGNTFNIGQTCVSFCLLCPEPSPTDYC